MGKEKFEHSKRYGQTQAHNVSSSPQENRCRSAGEVGEGESWQKVILEDYVGDS